MLITCGDENALVNNPQISWSSFNRLRLTYVGQDSSVGIVTHYGLNGPGSDPLGGKIFRTRPDFCTMGTGSFLGRKAAGAWR
jgi:hypothetical protein